MAKRNRTKKPSRAIMQIKVTLSDSQPAIWRRVLVSADKSLGDFHYILQDAMGWTDSHLHQFFSGRTCSG